MGIQRFRYINTHSHTDGGHHGVLDRHTGNRCQGYQQEREMKRATGRALDDAKLVPEEGEKVGLEPQNRLRFPPRLGGRRNRGSVACGTFVGAGHQTGGPAAQNSHRLLSVLQSVNTSLPRTTKF